MYKNLRITAVIPCLNEEVGIGKVLGEVPPFVDEIIVVDNGSTDRTAVIARDMGAHVISELHRGYGKAYKSGFSRATGDIIVTLDGDHSYPVDALSYLLEAFMHCRVGFVSASRFPMLNDAAMTPKHKFGNRILSLAMSVLFLRWIHDSQSGMWVFRRYAPVRTQLVWDGMGFRQAMKIGAGRDGDIGVAQNY